MHWPTAFIPSDTDILPLNKKFQALLDNDVDYSPFNSNGVSYYEAANPKLLNWLYLSVWRQLNEIQKLSGGKLRSLGVSNFSVSQLERLINDVSTATRNLECDFLGKVEILEW